MKTETVSQPCSMCGSTEWGGVCFGTNGEKRLCSLCAARAVYSHKALVDACRRANNAMFNNSHLCNDPVREELEAALKLAKHS